MKINRILFIIFLFALILVSCVTNQDVFDNQESQADENNIQESDEIQTENNTTESPEEVAKPINYNINFS